MFVHVALTVGMYYLRIRQIASPVADSDVVAFFLPMAGAFALHSLNLRCWVRGLTVTSRAARLVTAIALPIFGVAVALRIGTRTWGS
jgi:hypothetical protein